MTKYSEAEADAFMRGFWWLIGGCCVVFAIPFIIYALYLDQRFDSFEDTLRYKNPVEVDEPDSVTPPFALTNLVQGQTVYVPAYSHVYHQDGRPHLLTITLSIRNTSLDNSVVIKSVRYFDTNGKEVKSYLNKSLRMPPLSSTEFLVTKDDTTGGSGANFIVEWVADKAVTQPMIETVMIDTSSQQGISFSRSGQVIREIRPEASDKQETEETSSKKDE